MVKVNAQPMKCDICKNTASVFYTQVVEGKMAKSSWCASCAEAQGVTDPAGSHLLNLLAEDAGMVVEDDFAGNEACSKCGFNLEDLQKTGRLGCPQCYQSFRQLLAARIEGMHRGVKHQGRVPKGLAQAQFTREAVAELEMQLNLAVEAEDFEEAARLRDQILKASKDKKAGA